MEDLEKMTENIFGENYPCTCEPEYTIPCNYCKVFERTMEALQQVREGATKEEAKNCARHCEEAREEAFEEAIQVAATVQRSQGEDMDAFTQDTIIRLIRNLMDKP